MKITATFQGQSCSFCSLRSSFLWFHKNSQATKRKCETSTIFACFNCHNPSPGSQSHRPSGGWGDRKKPSGSRRPRGGRGGSGREGRLVPTPPQLPSPSPGTTPPLSSPAHLIHILYWDLRGSAKLAEITLLSALEEAKVNMEWRMKRLVSWIKFTFSSGKKERSF